MRRSELNLSRRQIGGSPPETGKHPRSKLLRALDRIFPIPTTRLFSLLPSYISSEQGGRVILRTRVAVPK